MFLERKPGSVCIQTSEIKILSIGNQRGSPEVSFKCQHVKGSSFGLVLLISSFTILRVRTGWTQEERRKKGRTEGRKPGRMEGRKPGRMKGRKDGRREGGKDARVAAQSGRNPQERAAQSNRRRSGVNNAGVYRPTVCLASGMIDTTHQTILGRAARASIINPHYKPPQCAEGTEGNATDLTVATTKKKSEIAEGASK